MIDSYLGRERLAKKAEDESRWREAAQHWLACGHKQDADACTLIADSVERGDAYREEVKRVLGPEPILDATNVRAWQKWHRDLSEIYRKHFL